jgi:hypothetical protein
MDQLYKRIAVHGAVAFGFFFMLQRFAMQQSTGSSLFWGVAMGLGAAALAWSQSRR